MKELFSSILLFLFVIFSSFSSYSQSARPESSTRFSNAFIEGVLTIKLKEGVGNYEKQEGMVYFNIASLDDLVQKYGIYKLEKRFIIGPRLSQPGMPDLSRIYKLSYAPENKLSELINAFSADPNIEYAEGNSISYPASIPNDSLFDICYHLPQIMAEEAWDIHKGEDGTEEVVIAIVDSGTDWIHEDLIDNVWQNLGEDADGDGHTIEFINDEWVLDPGDLADDHDLNGYTNDLIGVDLWQFYQGNDYSNPDPAPHSNNHGTFCAGIAAGRTNNEIGISSISYNVKYMAIKVDDGDNNFWYSFEGIAYAAEMGADIISCSFGQFNYSEAEREVIEAAALAGSIIVAGAGNENNDLLQYPAHYLDVVSVANVDENDIKSTSSSYNLSVDVSAPGVNVKSTQIGNEYTNASGTSFSCPAISGSLALLKSYHPDWTNEQLINQLIATSDEIDTFNSAYEYLLGSGRVNAYEMLLGLNLEDPYLKLGLTEICPIDENGNNINEAGESVTLDFAFRNYMHTYSADNVNLTLSTSDPDITITDADGIIDIRQDTFIYVVDQFEFEIASNAQSHYAEFNLHVEADIPIPVGEDLLIRVMIKPSGCYVYDGIKNGQDFSGEYIYNYFIDNDYNATYGTAYEFPKSLVGFEAVFLCFGNFSSGHLAFDDHYVDVVTEYIESGGDVYLEGADIFGWDQSGNNAFYELFGIDEVNDGDENNIGSLDGMDDAVTAMMEFNGSEQISVDFIDILSPLSVPEAKVAFEELNYGSVAVQYDSPEGYETFCFSYALAQLEDESIPSTRNHLIQVIKDFFDSTTGIEEAIESDPFSIRTFPNPTSTGTTIRYNLHNANNISIEIMNSQGQLVEQQKSQFQAQGQHEFYWNAEDLPSGVYYYSLRSDSHKSTGKIIVF